MKLEKLVPHIKLCKLIPEGEFGDSALIMIAYPKLDPNGDNIYKVAVVPRDMCMCMDESAIQEIYPAPTWEEIMEDIGQFTASRFDKGYQIETATGWECASSDTAVDGAMKLWLKQRGIDYGN